MFTEGTSPQSWHSSEIDHLDMPISPTIALAIDHPDLFQDARKLSENSQIVDLLDLLSKVDERGAHA